MASTATNPRQQAHELIDRMAPSQVSAMVSLIETMLDPVSRAIANAPIDDEVLSDECAKSLSEAGEWLKREMRDGDVVLLKASRGVKLEKALEIWQGRRPDNE